MLLNAADSLAINRTNGAQASLLRHQRRWQHRRQHRRQPPPFGRVLAAAEHKPGNDSSSGGGSSSSSSSSSIEGRSAVVVDSAAFLTAGTVGNSAMAAAGIALGNWAGLDVWGQWVHGGLSIPAAAAYTAPLLAACYWGVTGADRLAPFGEMRQLFKATLIPQLRVLPFWGLGLLALGAGVGEETLFRAYLQAAAQQGLLDAAPQLPAAAATAAALAGTSMLFGAVHALSPVYFLYATGAGALFGVEYLTHGLPTAAATHFVYDWVALWYILREWGGASDSGGGGAAADEPDEV